MNGPNAPHAPAFILGRQHSGNTMLATMLARLPDVYSQTGEGRFFDHLSELKRLDAESGMDLLARLIATAAEPTLDVGEVLPLVTGCNARSSREQDGPRWKPAELYDRTMTALAESRGKRRWAQKATSHIFYARAILHELPEAKLIFITRNPFDITASLKRRHRRDMYLRAIWGWNRGMRLAVRLKNDLPDQFMIVRYEDIVSQPHPALSKICCFIGGEFIPSALEVPHVNRSDTPYNLCSEGLGLQQERIGYFWKVLDEEEIGLAARFVDVGNLYYLYPEAKEWYTDIKRSGLSTSAAALASSVFDIVRWQVHVVRSHPYTAIDRVLKRIC